MVKLRLRRKGRTHHAVYDIVAVDGRKRRDGAFIERLGYYDPNTSPNTVNINHNRAIYWLNVGAQPTGIVNNLLSFEGVLLRRHLLFKGKSQVEIDEQVDKHRQIALDRFHRRKELRKKREAAKAAEKPAEG